MKKYLILLILLSFFCLGFRLNVSVIQDEAGIINTNGTISRVSLVTNTLDNVIVEWDFSGATGGETGVSGTGQAGNLDLIENGTIDASLSNVPAWVGDDGKSRKTNGINNYFKAAQKFTEGLTNFTIEVFYRTPPTFVAFGATCVSHSGQTPSPNNGGWSFSHSLAQTNRGATTLNLDSTTSIVQDITCPIVVTVDTWYHTVLVKSGTSFKVAIREGAKIENATDLANALWTSNTQAGTFVPQHPFAMGVQQLGPTPSFGGYGEYHFAKIIISNVAKFQ